MGCGTLFLFGCVVHKGLVPLVLLFRTWTLHSNVFFVFYFSYIVLRQEEKKKGKTGMKRKRLWIEKRWVAQTLAYHNNTRRHVVLLIQHCLTLRLPASYSFSHSHSHFNPAFHLSLLLVSPLIVIPAIPSHGILSSTRLSKYRPCTELLITLWITGLTWLDLLRRISGDKNWQKWLVSSSAPPRCNAVRIEMITS